MKKNLFWHLEKIDLFKDLSDLEIDSISNYFREKKCYKKELIYTPDSEVDRIYFLKKGEVTLYFSKNGKRQILDILGPDSIFGPLSYKTKKVDHFAEFTKDGHLCSVKINDFLLIASKFPSIFKRLLEVIGEKFAGNHLKIKNNILSAEERVLEFINSQKNEQSIGALIKSKFIKPKKITHALIAQSTGLSRETVSRVMQKLKNEEKL